MNKENLPENELRHIRSMMERSSRFISLSGLSGVAAGFCGLVGAVVAYPYVMGQKPLFIDVEKGKQQWALSDPAFILNSYLFWIAAFTLVAAVLAAFIFTYIRSKKQGIPVWGHQATRLAINIAIPLFIGGLFLLKAIVLGAFLLVVPGCLIFYGLALLNASKYTVPEIRLLAISQLALAAVNLFIPYGYGIYFWTIGFGLLHIIYGILMWYKYERGDESILEKQ